MHETIIAKDIIETAQKQGVVKEIVVEVGQLGHLPINEMRDVLEELVDWKVTVIEKKAVVRCKCGYEGDPKVLEKGHDHNVFICPKCENIPEVLEGEDIVLKKVVVDEMEKEDN